MKNESKKAGRPAGTFKLPSHRYHVASGGGIVTIAGRDRYTGKWTSPTKPTKASREKYERLLHEMLANGGTLIPSDITETTVNELIAVFLSHVKRELSPASLNQFRLPCAHLRRSYGEMRVNEFKPLHLRTIRETMIGRRIIHRSAKTVRPFVSRFHINRITKDIRHVFEWGSENGVVKQSVAYALRAVKPLKPGRTEARELPEVVPPRDQDIEAVMAIACPHIQTMMRLQLLTGMRPGEVVQMRGCDIEMPSKPGASWVYRPEKHKTLHMGKTREVHIGPKAQEVLRPWLRPNVREYLFSPRESMANNKKHTANPANRARQARQAEERRRNRKKNVRPFAEKYPVSSYAGALYILGNRADRLAHKDRPEVPADVRLVERFHPHQLRHHFATRVVEEQGLEVGRILLGHSSIKMTERYSRRRHIGDAAAAILKIG